MDTALRPVETVPRTARNAPPPRGANHRDVPFVAFAVATSLIGVHVVDGLSVQSDLPTWARVVWGMLAVLAVPLVILAFRSGTRSVRAALALVIGVGATVTGIGLTLAGGLQAGFSDSDYTGIASLVGGLALLAVGTETILGAVRRWRKLLALPIGLVVIYYLIWPLTVAVFVTHRPHIDLGTRTPAASNVAYRDVTVLTPDGVRLSGWYVPSRNRAAVIALHGAGSTRSAVLAHLVVLARHGYGVLAIDARGHGLSEGEAMDWGWYGDLDIAGAVSFLTRQPDIDPARIGALGLSMGGEEALSAAASDPRIAAVVSEGAGMRAFSDVGSIPTQGLNRMLSLPHYWLMYTTGDLMSGARAPAFGTEEAVRRIAPRPVLLIAGNTPSEIGFNERFQASAPGSTELWRLADTPHTQAIRVHRTEWSERVIGFFDRALMG